MAESTAYLLDYKEILTAIIKQQGLHEGIWQLHIEFGLAAANIATAEDQISPAAILAVKRIGIMRIDKESPIAIDAAKVNPAPSKPSNKSKKK